MAGNLTEVAFEPIRDGTVDEALTPGTRIGETKAGSQPDVSKTPVRDLACHGNRVAFQGASTRHACTEKSDD
jgi:hypothetical protein